MLPEFIIEAERLATLEGNVGRKVTRGIEQLFPNNLFERTFDCHAAVDLVDCAVFVLRMQSCAALKRAEVGDAFSISVQTTELHCQAKVVVIPMTTPATLKEKQRLLLTFAGIMRSFTVFAIMSDRLVLDKGRREYLEDQAFTPADVQYTYLAELVKGDYTHLVHTGGNFLSLANALNPEVEGRRREVMAQDELPV